MVLAASIAMILSIAFAGGSIFLFLLNYRRYYQHLKAVQYESWKELMYADPFIANIGEWFRWPMGSSQMIFSVFRSSQSFNDPIVFRYKTNARRAFFAFLLAVPLSVIVVSTIK